MWTQNKIIYNACESFGQTWVTWPSPLQLRVHKRVHYSKCLSYKFKGPTKCYPISNKIWKPSFKSWLFLLYNSFFFLVYYHLLTQTRPSSKLLQPFGNWNLIHRKTHHLKQHIHIKREKKKKIYWRLSWASRFKPMNFPHQAILGTERVDMIKNSWILKEIARLTLNSICTSIMTWRGSSVH